MTLSQTVITGPSEAASHASVKKAGVASIAMVLLFLTFTFATLSLILATSPVCKTDAACMGFPLPSAVRDGLDNDTVANMTCYKGGETVFNNHQMCDITVAQKNVPMFACFSLKSITPNRI